MKEGSFGSVVRCHAELLEHDPKYFEHIKRELYINLADFLFPEMIDSNNYHVLKLSMYRNENNYQYPEIVEFYIKGSHAIAQQQTYKIAVFDDFEIPKSAKPCCQWCGNELRLDKRGGCSACGGWPK